MLFRSRIGLGCRLDEQGKIGLEAGGFLLESRSNGFSMPSTAAPFIGLPIFTDGSPNAFPLVAPGFFIAGVNISNQTQLWGADSNVVLNVLRRDSLTVHALTGFRYLDLQERLDVVTVSPATDPAANFASNDAFQTQNRF